MTNREMTVSETAESENDIYRTSANVFFVVRDVFIIATLVFFLLRLDAYLFLRGALPVAPIFLMSVWIVTVGLIGVSSSLFEHHYLRSFNQCWPIILPFVFIVGFSWMGILGEQANFAENHKYLLYPTLDFGLFLTGILLGVMKVRKGIFRLGMAIAWTVVVATSFADVFYPGTFSEINSRAAGIFENPNIAAFTIVIFTATLLQWEKKSMNLPDLFLFLLSGVAVFFTFSRGGAIQFIVLAFLYWMNMASRQRLYFVIQIAVFILLLVAGISFLLPDYTSQIKILELNTTRVDWYLGNFSDAFPSDESRLELFREAVQIVVANPLTGLGTGYVASMFPYGPHNIYLSRWIENGIFGMLSYVWLLIAVLVMNKVNGNFGGCAVAVMVIMYGIISDQALDDRTILLLLSIITAKAIVNRNETAEEKL